jgi:hypothetical protein
MSYNRFWSVAVQHCSKFGDFCIDPELLSFESFDSSLDDFVCEFHAR